MNEKMIAVMNEAAKLLMYLGQYDYLLDEEFRAKMRKLARDIQEQLDAMDQQPETPTPESAYAPMEIVCTEYHPTRRDYFTAAALAGLISKGVSNLPVVGECVKVADMVIGELDRTE